VWTICPHASQVGDNYGYNINRKGAIMETMVNIGVRELRDGLSKHLALVKEGETITVTEHGRAIARIVPAGPSKLDELIAQGRVTPAKKPKTPLPPPLKLRDGAAVSDLIADQRR
jgi:prevent-host-death family protein